MNTPENPTPDQEQQEVYQQWYLDTLSALEGKRQTIGKKQRIKMLEALFDQSNDLKVLTYNQLYSLLETELEYTELAERVSYINFAFEEANVPLRIEFQTGTQALGIGLVGQDVSIDDVNDRLRSAVRKEVGDLITESQPEGALTIGDTTFSLTSLEVGSYYPLDFLVIHSPSQAEEEKDNREIVYVSNHQREILELCLSKGGYIDQTILEQNGFSGERTDDRFIRTLKRQFEKDNVPFIFERIPSLLGGGFSINGDYESRISLIEQWCDQPRTLIDKALAEVSGSFSKWYDFRNSEISCMVFQIEQLSNFLKKDFPVDISRHHEYILVMENTSGVRASMEISQHQAQIIRDMEDDTPEFDFTAISDRYTRRRKRSNLVRLANSFEAAGYKLAEETGISVGKKAGQKTNWLRFIFPIPENLIES